MVERRRAILAAILLGIGTGGLILAIAIRQEGSRRTAARPAATGHTGAVAVYGQLPNGFARLVPSQVVTLPRPQDLAFSVTADGTGPRRVRVDLDGRRVHEEVVTAPLDSAALGYVMHLGDAAPDDVELTVSIEAPHNLPVVSTFRVHLIGGEER